MVNFSLGIVVVGHLDCGQLLGVGVLGKEMLLRDSSSCFVAVNDVRKSMQIQPR